MTTVDTPINLGGSRFVDIYASAPRTSTPDIQEIYGARDGDGGIIVVFDVTAVGASPSLTLTVSGVDPLSGKTWPLVTVVPVTAIGTYVVRVHPNNPTAAIASGVQTQQGQIPDHVQVGVAHSNGSSYTYSVSVISTN